MTARPASESMSLSIVRRQLSVTWSLAERVLDDLTHDECVWVPSAQSWTDRPTGPHGAWVADWEEPEPWPAPPTSLGWVLWHAIWWWSMVIDHAFGVGTLSHDGVHWPGADESLPRLRSLHREWVAHLHRLTDDDLVSDVRTRWPYTDGRPFGQVVGWVNIELMKNVAEMSLTRRTTPFYADGRFEH